MFPGFSHNGVAADVRRPWARFSLSAWRNLRSNGERIPRSISRIEPLNRSAGGYLGGGTIFEISTNGGAFANLHNFDFATEGDSPYANLILSGNVLSATTSEGGVWGGGTVFDLNLTVTSPPLTVNGAGSTIAVEWPWPSVGFALQQNTNLAATNWLSFPGTINDNGIIRSAPVSPSVGKLFFRLQHP